MSSSTLPSSLRTAWSLAVATVLTMPSQAQDAPAKPDLDAVVAKAVDYLRGVGQGPDGSFSPQVGPGITAMVVAGVLRNTHAPDEPMVAKALKNLTSFVQPDGGIYAPNSRLKNYETCIALVALSEANVDGRYDETINSAARFLRGLQYDEKDHREPSDIAYGGVGYGGRERPDLSNTHFLIEALGAAGAEGDDEAIQRAILFVSRCQNFESEHNTTAFAAKIGDGGFYYTPIGKGSSPAGTTADGGLRSYGSMTYAGLKSMLYAGVKADDPRVKAALEWARQHYSFDENPGLGQAGLYYYYHLQAKALAAHGQAEFADASGQAHDWKAEMIAALAQRQRPDGSWVNSDDRWMEGDPNLATGFALLALSYCR